MQEKERSHLDHLTGLANRRQMALWLSQLKEQDSHCLTVGVLFVDLDGFKGVNDQYGHEVGDSLLIEVAGRIEQACTLDEKIIRLGGDEFVILVLNAKATRLKQLAEELIQRLNIPFALTEPSIHIGASIGYTCYPQMTKDLDALLHDADAAMYAAKNLGKNQVVNYSSLLHDGHSVEAKH